MSMSMAELLAKQEHHVKKLSRGDSIEGTIITINPQELILDLGAKSEGVLAKKDINGELFKKLQVGNTLSVFVLSSENESGQVVLSMQRSMSNIKGNASKIQRFLDHLQSKKILTAKVMEANKGGLIVEVNGTRGFLPSSQLTLRAAMDIDSLVGKEIKVVVIEADPGQNRLIFAQKIEVSDELKAKLNQVQPGQSVKAKVEAILPFGIFVTALELDLEGFVHISEASWEKLADLNSVFQAGQELDTKVLSVDFENARLNLSVKGLSEDPFGEATKDFQVDDVIKATVNKISNLGVHFVLAGGVEGLLPASKIETGSEYQVGEAVTLTVDSIDAQKRRINLVPFITSTKDLIYK